MYAHWLGSVQFGSTQLFFVVLKHTRQLTISMFWFHFRCHSWYEWNCFHLFNWNRRFVWTDLDRSRLNCMYVVSHACSCFQIIRIQLLWEWSIFKVSYSNKQCIQKDPFRPSLANSLKRYGLGHPHTFVKRSLNLNEFEKLMFNS